MPIRQVFLVVNSGLNFAQDYSFTDDSGNGQTYAANAAGVYVEIGQDITIQDCEIHGNGNGIFIGINGGQTRDIVIRRNHIHGNGVVGTRQLKKCCSL